MNYVCTYCGEFIRGCEHEPIFFNANNLIWVACTPCFQEKQPKYFNEEKKREGSKQK